MCLGCGKNRYLYSSCKHPFNKLPAVVSSRVNKLKSKFNKKKKIVLCAECWELVGGCVGLHLNRPCRLEGKNRPRLFRKKDKFFLIDGELLCGADISVYRFLTETETSFFKLINGRQMSLKTIWR